MQISKHELAPHYRRRLLQWGIPAAVGIPLLIFSLGGWLAEQAWMPVSANFIHLVAFAGGLALAVWAWWHLRRGLLRQQLADPDYAPADDGPDAPPAGFFRTLAEQMANPEAPGAGGSRWAIDRGAPQAKTEGERWAALGWSSDAGSGPTHYLIHMLWELTRGGDSEELQALAARIHALKGDPATELPGLLRSHRRQKSVQLFVYVVGGSSAQLQPALAAHDVRQAVHLRSGGRTWSTGAGAHVGGTSDPPQRFVQAHELTSMRQRW